MPNPDVRSRIGRQRYIGRTPGREVWGIYAALTELRNLPTSTLRRLLSLESDRAADSTSVEAEPVSVAPRWTSVILELTSVVPAAACCTLREISCVAAPCSSTAAAMVEATGVGQLLFTCCTAAKVEQRVLYSASRYVFAGPLEVLAQDLTEFWISAKVLFIHCVDCPTRVIAVMSSRSV